MTVEHGPSLGQRRTTRVDSTPTDDADPRRPAIGASQRNGRDQALGRRRLARWRLIVVTAWSLPRWESLQACSYFQYRPDRQVDDAAAHQAIAGSIRRCRGGVVVFPRQLRSLISPRRSRISPAIFWPTTTNSPRTIVAPTGAAEANHVRRPRWFGPPFRSCIPDSAVVLVFVDQIATSKDKPKTGEDQERRPGDADKGQRFLADREIGSAVVTAPFAPSWFSSIDWTAGVILIARERRYRCRKLHGHCRVNALEEHAMRSTGTVTTATLLAASAFGALGHGGHRPTRQPRRKSPSTGRTAPRPSAIGPRPMTSTTARRRSPAHGPSARHARRFMNATGTVTSDQGWSAPIYMQDGTIWDVKHEVPNWERCTDGTAFTGQQTYSFYPVDNASGGSQLGSPILAGKDKTIGPSGACGQNQWS